MIPVLSAEQMRRADEIAIRHYGIPVVVLMDHAGRAVAEAARRMLRRARSRRVLVLAGGGNNGGDGVVAARYLQGWGFPVEVFWIKDPAEWGGHLQVHYAAARRTGVRFARFEPARLERGASSHPPAALLIDALLGTGASGELRAVYRSAIEAVNRARRPVIAVDIPSGLDANTGRSLGATIKARLTVTMAAPKTGLLRPEARPFVGRLVVADIGIPEAALRAAASRPAPAQR